MAYSVVPSVITGDSWTAGNQNTYVRDNFKAGIPDIFTAPGDMPYATGADGAAADPIGTSKERYFTEGWRGIIGCSLSITGTAYRFYTYYTGTPDKVIWNTENYDPDGMWDSNNPDAVIIPYTGIYRLSGFIYYTKSEVLAYTKYFRVYIGPSDKAILVRTPGLSNPGFPFEYIGKFTQGDDVYLRVSLNAGTDAQRATGTTYFVTYLGPET